MAKLLIVDNIKAYYRIHTGEEVKAVDGVTLNIRKNEVFGIAGESGCGKSTLANVLSCAIYPPLHLIEGRIVVDGKNLFELNREKLRRDIQGRYVSVVPQSAMNALNPTIRIRDLVFDLMREHFPDTSKKEAIKSAKKRFEALSLPADRVLNSYPHELSGGMKQRVIIIISTLLSPKVLIADEPTSALDVSSQKIVIKLLIELMKKNIIQSTIFITHELPILRHFSDRIAIMYAGKVVEIGTTQQIIFNPLHPYTKVLISSILVPEPDIKSKKIRGISGAPPDLRNPPSGCRFHPRCNNKEARCEVSAPPMRQVNGKLVSCWLVDEKKENV